jgi:transposase
MPKSSANQPPDPASALPRPKRYTRQFKLDAVRLLQTSGQSKAALERELGLYPGQLRQWELTLTSSAGPIPSDPGQPPSGDAELRQLRRENAILRQERDILKKAIAIFSKMPDQGSSSPSFIANEPRSTSPSCVGCWRFRGPATTPGASGKTSRPLGGRWRIRN